MKAPWLLGAAGVFGIVAAFFVGLWFGGPPVEPAPPHLDGGDPVVPDSAGSSPAKFIAEIERANPFLPIPCGAVELQTHEVAWGELAIWESARSEKDAGGSSEDAGRSSGERTGAIDKDPNEPASDITYDRATRFCEALGGRLPTAEEWLSALNKDKPRGSADVGWAAKRWDELSKLDRPLRKIDEASTDVSPSGHRDLLGNLRELIQDLPQDQCPPERKNGEQCHWHLGAAYSDKALKLSYVLTPKHFFYTEDKWTGHPYCGFRCARPSK